MNNNINLEIEEDKKKKQTETKIEEIYRVTVSKEADSALDAIIKRVNEGFEAGKINRSDAVTWILCHTNKSMNDSLVQEIRADHFDEMALLEAMFKKAKKAGAVPAELKGLLLRHSGIEAINQKRSREKTGQRLTEKFINDEISSKSENSV